MDYQPINNDPGTRKRLLRELSRETMRVGLQTDRKSVRKAVSRLTNFEALNALSIEEKAFLKSFAEFNISWRLNRRLEEGNDETGYGSRGVDSYFGDLNISVLEHSTDKIEQDHLSKLRILDVGSCGAEMLNDLKTVHGDLIETHSLDPYDNPRAFADIHHRCFAEYQPACFKEQYDLIVSNRALEYTVFPHIALRNIADALKPSGKAILQWRGGRTFSGFVEGEVELEKNYMSLYADIMPTEADTQSLIKHFEVVNSWDKKWGRESRMILTAEKIRGSFDHWTQYWMLRQDLLWNREVDRLQSREDLELNITSYTLASAGWYPGTIFIDKKASVNS